MKAFTVSARESGDTVKEEHIMTSLRKHFLLRNRSKAFILLSIISIWIILHYKITITNLRKTSSSFILESEVQETRSAYVESWCRVEKMRRDWRSFLKPCKDKLTWTAESKPWQNPMSTDPDKSYISLWDMKPAGQFSRLSIQSQTREEKSKHDGGDAWRVHLRGPASIAPTVIDHDNGTYEILFLAMEPGKYQVEIMLDYTMCDGLRDPPEDWFIRGNSQGKNQPQGILGNDQPYILKPLWGGSPLEITIPPQISDQTKWALKADAKYCTTTCNYLWNGLGRWVNGTWKPYYLPDTQYPKWHRRGNGLLWIYGDSVALNLYNSMRRKRLCTEIFQDCGYSYNWVYQMENYNLTQRKFVKRNLTKAKTENDDLDFSVDRILNEFSQVVFHPKMDENGAVLVNLGLHYVENTNFTNYQTLINGLIRLLREGRTMPSDAREVRKFKGRFIWKTTTAINREKYSANYLHSRRFLTYQRIQLYNAFAIGAMCEAGLEVLDVYPLTDSFPGGTGRPAFPYDPVHYQPFVFDSMEKLLELYFSP